MRRWEQKNNDKEKEGMLAKQNQQSRELSRALSPGRAFKFPECPESNHRKLDLSFRQGEIQKYQIIYRGERDGDRHTYKETHRETDRPTTPAESKVEGEKTEV